MESKPQIMTHIVLGYPTLEKSIELVQVMSEIGVSYIEIQVPFSDPIADGQTIMMANEVALKNKITTKDCIDAVKELSTKIKTPLIIMSYFNMLINYQGGTKGFIQDAAKAGIYGLIIPDITIDQEQTDHFYQASYDSEVCPIPLVSPVTSGERMQKICDFHQSTGGKKFSDNLVYCISSTATTGSKGIVTEGIQDYLKEVGKYFSIPRAVGFGISSKEDIAKISKQCEIAVIGSATINTMNANPGSEIESAKQFLLTLLN